MRSTWFAASKAAEIAAVPILVATLLAACAGCVDEGARPAPIVELRTSVDSISRVATAVHGPHRSVPIVPIRIEEVKRIAP